MAKKQSGLSMDIRGVKIDKLLQIDVNTINRMNSNTLKKVVERLVAVANRRMGNLERAKLSKTSSAYIHRKESAKADAYIERKKQRKEIRKKRKQGIKGLRMPRGRVKVDPRFHIPENATRQQMMKIHKQAKEFLSAKTSTVEGTKKVQSELEQAVGRPLTESENRRLWKLYHKLDEGFIKLFGFDSKEVVKDIAKRVAKRKYDGIAEYEKNADILKRWEDRFKQQYEIIESGRVQEINEEDLISNKKLDELRRVKDPFGQNDDFGEDSLDTKWFD